MKIITDKKQQRIIDIIDQIWIIMDENMKREDILYVLDKLIELEEEIDD